MTEIVIQSQNTFTVLPSQIEYQRLLLASGMVNDKSRLFQSEKVTFGMGSTQAVKGRFWPVSEQHLFEIRLEGSSV